MARVFVTFTGVSAKGPITVSGLKVGDELLSAIFKAVPVGDESLIGLDATGQFSKVVFVHNQLFQSVGTDLSGFTMVAILDRDVVV